MAASVIEAKAEADEAMPEPAGKLLDDSTRARKLYPAAARTKSR